MTTVTFEDRGDTTLLTLREVYSSPDGLDEIMAGTGGGMAETFDQLDELLAAVTAAGGKWPAPART